MPLMKTGWIKNLGLTCHLGSLTPQIDTEESYTYDVKGNILTATNKDISYTFSYDAAGRMLSSTDSSGKVIQYAYDVGGKKTKTIYPEGSVVSYSYDTAGRLAAIADNGKTYGYTYDTLGRRVKLSYPNGTTANYNYDNTGRLTSLTHKGALGLTIDSFTYTHDKIGNRLSIKKPAVTTNYIYDAIYRLTQVKPSLPWEITEQYTYDPVGNRLNGPKASISYLYNQGNQLIEETTQAAGFMAGLFGLTSAATGKAEYTFDKNGNLIKKTTPTGLPNTTITTLYSYDFENQLTQTEIHYGPATVTVQFTYDPLGRRIGKKTIGKACQISGTDTHTYVYDGQNIIQEYRDTNVLGADFIGTSRYLHGPGTDEPLSLTRNNNTWHYHQDGLGSIIALSNKYGIVVDRYDYDSFGNQKPGLHVISQPYAYTGREWDKEAGLYYYRARYYDPMEGRFIQKDPIAILGNNYNDSYNITENQRLKSIVNPFAYTDNNPINYTDPTGLASWHFDYSKLGERLIHYGKYRFNRAGELVEHTGRVIKDIPCDAAKALEWLKNVKPDFFRAVPFLLLLPGQEQMLNNFNNPGGDT